MDANTLIPGAINKESDQPKSWRDVMPVHPAADLFPPMNDAELRELAADIKKNGQQKRSPSTTTQNSASASSTAATASKPLNCSNGKMASRASWLRS